MVDAASQQLSRRVQRPFNKRFVERQRALQTELSEVLRTHTDDDEARHRATMEVYRKHKVRPWGSCGLGFLGLVPKYLPALWSPRRQTLRDRVAGVIVVVERSE